MSPQHRLTVVGTALCLLLGTAACGLRQNGHPESTLRPTSLPESALRQDAFPEPVRIGGNIRPPQKTKDVNPQYPRAAREERVTGVVILDVLVDPDGRVTDTEVLRSVPGLDDAALEAVSQWENRPTLLNGVAVPVIMTVTVNFQLP